MRRTLSCLILVMVVSSVLASPSVKGERSYAEHDKIVLTADGVDKGTQILWDVSGDAQVEEGEGKLFVWAKPGRYSVTMTAINFDTKKIARARFTFVVLASTPPKPPEPEPKPPEPKPPEPKPKEQFIDLPGTAVLIVYESKTSTELPKGQQSIIFGKKVRDWLRDNCLKDQGNSNGAFRIYDKDIAMDGESDAWKNAMKRKRDSVPWLVISTPKGSWEGPLPKDEDEMLTRLNSHLRDIGGKK